MHAQLRHALLAILLLCLAVPVRADDSSSSSGGNNTTVKLPPPPTVSDPEPPKPQDRQKSSAAAKAAALGGAAMSKVMCMAMMAQAMQEQNQSNKMMEMMMGQMACQQAAQMEQSAAENDKGQKLASQADIPKQSQLTAKGMELPTGAPKEEKAMAFNPRAVQVDEGSKPDDLTQQLAVPDLSVFEKKQAAQAPAAAGQPGPDDGKALRLSPEDATTALAPIDPGKIKYDDAAKTGAAGATTGGGGLVNLGNGNLTPKGSTASSGATSGELRGSGEPVADSKGSGRGKLRGRGADGTDGGTAAAGSGGGGGNGGGSGSGDSFEAMLSQLLGGPGGGEPAGGSGSLSEIVPLPKRNEPGKQNPNIFEYATFRYHKLTYEAARVRSKAGKPKTLPAITAVARAAKP